MDVAPWNVHWIKMVLDGIEWYQMVFNGVEQCCIVFDCIGWFGAKYQKKYYV